MILGSDFYNKDLEFGKGHLFCQMNGVRLEAQSRPSSHSLGKISEIVNEILSQDQNLSLKESQYLKRNIIKLNDKILSHNTWWRYLLHFVSFGKIGGIIKPLNVEACNSFEKKEAAKILQSAFRKTHRVKKYFLDKAQDEKILTPDILSKRYSRIDRIANGAQGIVDSYRHNPTNELRAVKICHTVKDRIASNYAVEITRYIYEKGLSPHVTYTYDLFLDLAESQRIYVMELLDGDMAKNPVSQIESLAFIVQITFTDRILSLLGVKLKDQLPCNYFLKKLTRKDVFRGKRLIEFDFWKYTIQKRDFYIPRQNNLVKLGDYDDWRMDFRGPEDLNLIYRFDLDPLTRHDLIELVQMFGTPPAKEAKVLDMGSVD